jgi:DNA-binding response OmpR family regulator
VLYLIEKELKAARGIPVNKRSAAEKFHILVIDDEPAVGDALKLVLEASGYGISLAATGRAGIAQAHANRFHVAIVDLGLPDTSGFAVIKTIRELQPGIVVILITTQITTEVLLEAQNLGAVEILSKPFRPEDILQVISRVLFH